MTNVFDSGPIQRHKQISTYLMTSLRETAWITRDFRTLPYKATLSF
jgi:hypothetical protein